MPSVGKREENEGCELRHAEIDTSYDLSCILNDALAEVLGNDSALRVIRFIENAAGRDIGELALYDPRQLVELLELALGSSVHKVCEELIKVMLMRAGCRPEEMPPNTDLSSLTKALEELSKCIRSKVRRMKHSYMDIIATIRSKANKQC